MVGTLGLSNQWGMFPKCCTVENSNLTENRFIRKIILAMPQSRNYDEVPVQIGRFCFCHNIHDLFYFLCFSSSKGGWLAAHCTFPPKSNPVVNLLNPLGLVAQS